MMKAIITTLLLSIVGITFYEHQIFSTPIEKEVTILKQEIKNIYGVKKLFLKIKNNTGKNIQYLKIKASFKNEENNQAYERISKNKYFYREINDLLESGETDNYIWTLQFFDDANYIENLNIEY